MAKLHSLNGEGLALIPGQGTRSHMLQRRPGTAKYINIKKKKKRVGFFFEKSQGRPLNDCKKVR